MELEDNNHEEGNMKVRSVEIKHVKTEVQIKHDEAIIESLLGGGSNKFLSFLPLPFDIILNIFSRLSPKEIFICKLVLKRAWRQIFKLTHFAHLQLQQQQEKSNGKVSFLFLTDILKKSSPLYYSEYNEINRTYVVTRVNHPLIKKRSKSYVLVGSCNGLVCFSLASAHNIDDPVSIYNPMTREFLYLPRFEIPAEFLDGTYKGGKCYLKCCMVSGFGYHAATGEYKIVRICYATDESSHYLSRRTRTPGLVQVYTLGSCEQWRNKGEITYTLGPGYGSSRGRHVDGFIYWLDNKDGMIVGFDLGVEEFSLLPAPPCNYFQIQEIGGCLCAVKVTEGEGVDIWSFKKENNEWESMFKLKINTIRHMVVNWPITVLRNDGVLLRDLDGLINYDTKTETWKKQDKRYFMGEAIPHVHSFVPLKALEQNTMKRKRR